MKNNYVAKYAHKANKSNIFMDRKKESKKGKRVKHKKSGVDKQVYLCFNSCYS